MKRNIRTSIKNKGKEVRTMKRKLLVLMTITVFAATFLAITVTANAGFVDVQEVKSQCGQEKIKPPDEGYSQEGQNDQGEPGDFNCPEDNQNDCPNEPNESQDTSDKPQDTPQTPPGTNTFQTSPGSGLPYTAGHPGFYILLGLVALGLGTIGMFTGLVVTERKKS